MVACDLSNNICHSSTSGNGSGPTYRNPDSSGYDLQVSSNDAGKTSGSSSLEVGRSDATSGSSRKVTRTDSAGGSSSFNGNISRQGSKYSRSGEAKKGKTEISPTMMTSLGMPSGSWSQSN